MAGGSASDVGSGGMATKVLAGKIARRGGLQHVHRDRPRAASAAAHRGRRRAAPGSSRRRRRRPCASSGSRGCCKPAGALHVDAGAAKALRGGKSLLPAGVTRVEGRFDRGDAVIVRDADGVEIARGLSAYSSEDARRVARPPQPGARGDSRVSWSRRNDPPRRPGADVTTTRPSLTRRCSSSAARGRGAARARARRAASSATGPCMRWRPRCARSRPRSSRPTQRDMRRGDAAGPRPRRARPPAARRRARRSHGARRRGHRGAAGSDRHGAGRVDAARTACASSACACRSASSASSTRAVRT